MVYVITLFQLIGVACFCSLLYFSIQRGQWLGAWQDKLRKWDLQGSSFKWHALGGCLVCTAHFVAFVSVFLYMYMTWDYGYLIARCFLYNFISAILNYLITYKLFSNGSE
jgi:hypothetical protein